ncbi:ATP-binding domain-containing protein [Trichocoleus desertorum AS-A10]|uniref:DEAD/DEAH box helicase n=1 Tax=Trichocoleus desertorum TaxID=1481672 RepID=UPI00329827C3
MSEWEFIVTDFVGADGEEGERLIWEAIVKALKGTGEGIAILNYSDFDRNRQIRYQPDILLVSRDFGLAVIEVKTCRIDQIVAIRANQWEMQKNFYARYMTPFKQGENQLWQILKRCDRNALLKDQLPGRVLVALPLISRDEWRERGFDDEHPTCPPILFGDELGRRSILNSLENNCIIFNQKHLDFELSDLQWKRLEGVIVGHPNSPKPIQPTVQLPSADPVPPVLRRADVLAGLRNWMSEVDIQQAKIGMQIPPGPQRIRGIAGSGKTLLLCQKAARMHIQHPDWDIALVFFTRSLYEVIPALIRQWLDYWSDGAIAPDLEQGKLKVIHAWGSKERPGLYSLLRDRAHVKTAVSEKPTGSIPERLAASCKRLLENVTVEPMFDAILIDEGQDLAVDDEWKYGDKQAIYWLAWQALRPVSDKDPSLKRLIWAYDEAQSLDALGVPSYGEVFGVELGGILSGSKTGPTYKGGIKKSEVMKRCYRTPGPTLVAAHGIGMGLLRQERMLSGFTTKADWQKIGYEVTEGNFTPGNWITLHRPLEHSPNPIPTPELWGRSPLEFEVYDDRESQLKELVEKIRHNVEQDELQRSRDILIMVLGTDQDSPESGQQNSNSQAAASLQLQRQVANNLQAQGIPYYIPGASDRNRYPDQSSRNADRFWWHDAITVSRMYRAKGHEAPMVYVLGLELVAQDESNLALRNQLFVALTRSMAWVHLSGIKDPDTHADYLLYDEMRRVIKSGNTLKFNFRKPKRTLVDNE